MQAIRRFGKPGCLFNGFEAMGKAHSQRGQVYAFKRERRAEVEFRAALVHFEEASANYKITQSYLFQYYLDTGNKEAYLGEAERYFGGKTKVIDQICVIYIRSSIIRV